MEKRKCFLILLLLMSYLGNAFGENRKVVRIIYDESYPPYSYRIKNKMIKGNKVAGGIYSDIVKKIFKDASLKDYKLVLYPVPWKAGLRKVKSGKEMAIYPPYFRPVERPYMKPYSIPILDEEVVLMCRSKIAKWMSGKIWPEDFIKSKVKIVRNRGFSYTALGETAVQAIKSGKWKLLEGGSTQAGLMMMVKKRVDCYFNDGLSILSEAKKLISKGIYDPGTSHSRFEKTIFIKDGNKQNFLKKETGHIGWSRRYNVSYKNDVISKVNSVIEKMKASGDIQKIIERHTK